MGYVYVAKTLHEDYKDIDNLYKIGSADDVDERIGNASSNSAFLYRDAVEVDREKCPDGKHEEVEKCVHCKLKDYHWPITETEKGEKYTAREWYKGASLQKIKDAIKECLDSPHST